MSSESKPVGANQWMVSENGQQQGPYTLDQMKQMVQEGRLSPAALVWTPGMSEWKPWKQASELGETTTATASPAPGPLPSYSQSALSFDKSAIGDYLFFRKMITPMIIQVIFWLGIAAVAIGSLISLISAFATGSALMIILGLFVSLMMFALGAITVRVYCELVILAFRIFETLTEIKEGLKKE